MKPSSTQTLIDALRILARDIGPDDSNMKALVAEAADRLDVMRGTIREISTMTPDIASVYYAAAVANQGLLKYGDE